jgi:hypothetical protein
MLASSYWITGRAVDELEGNELEKFDEARREFIGVFAEEELYSPLYSCTTYRANIMKQG